MNDRGSRDEGASERTEVQDTFAVRAPVGGSTAMRGSYGPLMATSFVDLLGLGQDRAVANARREMLRPRAEERLIAELIDALARRDAARVGHADVCETAPMAAPAA
jgi:hypothetical protein